MKIVQLLSLALLPVVVGAHDSKRVSNSKRDVCEVSPSGTVYITIGSPQPFGNNGECSGLIAEISPDNGTAGFGSSGPCTTVSTGFGGGWKIEGCSEGNATLSVWDGATEVQSVSLIVQAP